MTRLELQDIFDRNNVPTNRYSFRGAGGGDVWALELVDGKFVLAYYDDRGSREQKTVYEEESKGCLALLAKVSDMLQGLQHRGIAVDPDCSPPLTS